MPGTRKPRKPRKPRKGAKRHDLKNAELIRGGHVARLTGNREFAVNLESLRHGGGGSGGGGGAGGGGGGADDLGRRLREAAEIINAQAKSNAHWSARIPPSLRVTGGAGGVSIISDAPPAYPNEVDGVRHPVFGGRGTRRPKAPWVKNQFRPFLAPAADQKGDAAAEAFAKVVDDWAKERGFK